MQYTVKTLLQLLRDPTKDKKIAEEYCNKLLEELEEIKSLIDSATAWYDLSESTLVEELLEMKQEGSSEAK